MVSLVLSLLFFGVVFAFPSCHCRLRWRLSQVETRNKVAKRMIFKFNLSYKPPIDGLHVGMDEEELKNSSAVRILQTKDV